MSRLIAYPNSGIANRLKSLISASLLDGRYKVYWPPETFCGLGYSDIFQDTYREIDHIPTDADILNTWRFELPPHLRELLPAGFSDCATGYKGIDFPGDVQQRNIDFEFLNIPHSILTILIKQFMQIRFSEKIMERVDARLRDLPAGFTGVHARTWFDEPERRNRWFDFDAFVAVCSRFRGSEMFVTSDDPVFIKSLSEALNKKLITMERAGQRVPKPWQQNSRDEMLDDIAELLVLSKASRLILTPMSTYSEAAWFFGECTEEVYFADPDFEQKGHAGRRSWLSPDKEAGKTEDDVCWIEVAGGTPSYFLALVPGHHIHLDHLNGGVHRIGDYVEKYRGYMKGSAPDDFMVDVGANLGLSAFPVASIKRRVVAFEPVADNAAAMRKSIARNGFDNVTLVECAVSGRVGETELYVPGGRSDNASFGRDVANANVSRPEVAAVTVRTETLDHWFAGHDREFRPGDARLLKIDVQGYETEVIAGAKEFIAACRPFEKLVMEFEFDPVLTTMAGYSTVDLLRLINSCGMEICYNGSRIAPESYADFCSRDISCDLLALFPPSGTSGQGGGGPRNEDDHDSGKMDMSDSGGLYGQDFYNSQILGSLQSAQIYLYHLFSIWGVPDSVADLGCGRGAWLATCHDLGVRRIVGFDGEWNSHEDMLDPAIEFHPLDLEKALPLAEPFDLAISLEVAEHLQPTASDTFVESLSRLSDAVLFGAAFTGQPGANHINTRPHSFWAAKFFARGYVLFDFFRPAFWNDERVEPCYRQNTFLYVKPASSLYRTLVARGFQPVREDPFIDCVHPAVYLGLLNEYTGLLHRSPQDPAKSEPPPVAADTQATECRAADSAGRLMEAAAEMAASDQLEAAADSYRRALAQDPNDPECLLRLSHVLLRMKCHSECLHHARHFLRLVTDVAFGYYLAGHAARELGRWQESRSYLLRAIELAPDNVYARVLCCMTPFTVCMDDAGTDEVMRTYADELGSLVDSTALDSAAAIDAAVEGIGAMAPFFLPYLGCDVTDLQRTYGEWVCAVMAAKYPRYALPLPRRTPSGKIRIGIVSGYFHYHSNWKIPIRGWLEQLDRSRFEVHCFHTGEICDAATETARSLADSFRRCSDPETLAAEIHEQGFDVLVYPGIGMETVTLKLAALRLAPVQCASWGHPVTTGMPTVDYYLSSDLMEPAGADRQYTERLVRLPNLSIWYDPPTPDFLPSRELVVPGLETHDVMFLCCQNLLKYLPRYDQVFPAIARQVRNARFVFISSQVAELTERFVTRIGQSFQDCGLNAADHVLMVPQLGEADFAALNARADIFLDSIEWSGCNTVFEALPYNTPVVTLPGAFMRGRHACAILRMMGVEETIAADVDGYVTTAVRLAEDRPWRDEIRDRMRRNKVRVYRDRNCITGLEDFLAEVTGRGFGEADDPV